MNLGNPSYWSAEWTFNDLVRTHGALKLVTVSGWQKLVDQLQMDATGHPINVPAGTVIAVSLQAGVAKLPSGPFECVMSKGWDVHELGDWKMRGDPTHFTMDISRSPSRLQITMMLTARKNGASLTHLSCTSQSAGKDELFNPRFLSDTAPFKVLRFMDWMKTNHAPLRTWSERPTPAFFSQAGPKGVALEYMVALANKLHADPWFTLPMDADEGYYRAFATYVRDNLDPDRKIYVELSNEVWNLSFQQAKDAMKRGHVLYPDIPENRVADFYYADRVRGLMAEWNDVFRGQEGRLVRIFATQAVNPRRAEAALRHKDTWKSVDALATAPYFGARGHHLAGSGQARIDAALAEGPALVDKAIADALEAKKVAAQFGLRYVAYEAGQHYASPVPGAREDMQSVSQDPRMEALYRRFLEQWKAKIGDTLVLYNSVSTPSSGGSFGHRLYTGQPVEDSPKMRAVMAAIGDGG